MRKTTQRSLLNPYRGVYAANWLRYPPARCGGKRGLPWKAVIELDGKSTVIGTFAVPQEAAIAYDIAAQKFRRSPKLNFPNL
jgi:hypothetical protein